jgi:serine/threonine protein kinase
MNPSQLYPNAEPVPGYKLMAKLGQGSFGEVWSAMAPGGFPVALKFVTLSGKAGEAELRSLQILRHIHHPNLLTVFGAWQAGPTLILAMEKGDRTLWDRFAEAHGQGLPGIPGTELLEYMREAAKGIDYLNAFRHNLDGQQQVGIQHRDIKPRNILLVGGGVKVADFGLARLLERNVTGHTGSLTLYYAAPEFFQGQTSHASDQYSLAASYCHLRGGRPPFAGTSAQVTAGHMMQPPDLSMLPPAEQGPVARGLAKHPAHRWPNCQSFVEALIQALRTSALVPAGAGHLPGHPGMAAPPGPQFPQAGSGPDLGPTTPQQFSGGRGFTLLAEDTTPVMTGPPPGTPSPPAFAAAPVHAWAPAPPPAHFYLPPAPVRRLWPWITAGICLLAVLVFGVAVWLALPGRAKPPPNPDQANQGQPWQQPNRDKQPGGQDPAQGQDPPRWAFRWKEGDRFFLESVEELSITLKPKGQVEQKLDVKSTFVSGYTVKQIDANKNIVLEQTVESFKVEGKFGAMGWNPADEKKVQPLVGAGFEVTLSPQGEVVRMGGYDKLLNRFPDKDRDMIRLFLMSEHHLKEPLLEVFAVLPDKPVRAGDRWQRRMKKEFISPLVELDEVKHFTNDGKQDLGGQKVEKLSYAVEATAALRKDLLPKEMKVVEWKLDLRLESNQGAVLFDAAKGRTVQSQLSLPFKGTIEVGVPGADKKEAIEAQGQRWLKVRVLDQNPKK